MSLECVRLVAAFDFVFWLGNQLERKIIERNISRDQSSGLLVFPFGVSASVPFAVRIATTVTHKGVNSCFEVSEIENETANLTFIEFRAFAERKQHTMPYPMSNSKLRRTAAVISLALTFLAAAARSLADTPPVRATEGLLSMGCQFAPVTKEAVLTDGIRVICSPSEYGYIDQAGKPLPLPKAEFRHLCRFQEGLAAVEIELPDDPTDGWGPQHWGFINHEGQFAIPTKFQYVDDFHEGLAAVNVGGKPYSGADPISDIPMVDWGRHFVYPTTRGKWGFVDKHGEFVIKPIYDRASYFSDGLAFVSLGSKHGYINKSGQMVIKLPSYSGGGSFAEGLNSYSQDEKYGYMDVTGKKVIPARFFSAWQFSGGLAQVTLSEHGKVGYINKSGEVVIKPQFDWVFQFSEGLAAVRVGDKVGFIDTSGKMVIPPRYEMAFDFCEGLAPVRIGSQWGYIDTTGKIVIAPRFVGAGLFRKGIARVATAGKTSGSWDDRVGHGTWGYIDHTGKFVIPPQFDQALDFWEGEAVITRYSKCGLKNAQGKVIVEPSYGGFGVFSEGLVAVFQNGRGGFLDPFTGRVTIPLRFDEVDGFSCGRAAVRLDDQWGFIDKAGNFVVKPQYWMVSAFSQGLAAVDAAPHGKNDACCNWGYIDITGKMVIPPQFGLAGNFSEGLACVWRRDKESVLGKAGYIDQSGKMVIEPRFDHAWDFHEGLARVEVRPEKPEKAPRKAGEDEDNEDLQEPPPEGKLGFIDKTGRFVIEPRFTWAENFVNGRAAVLEGKKQYQVDTKGKLYEVEKEAKH